MTLARKFLSLSPEQRGLVFEQAAAGLAGHDVILEKDFWVSWLLGLLFAQPKLAPFLVFKGGTSLSKVFGVIDRFSEDIDLCLGPEFLGADTAGYEALKSRVKRDAAVLEMHGCVPTRCSRWCCRCWRVPSSTHWAARLQVNGCIASWMRMPSRPFCFFGIRARGLMVFPTCGAR
jgi:hypothetical protein